MEYEENKADWGQAYDYSFAAHHSTTGQKQSKKFPSDPLASSFKAGRGKIIVHHFACKYTSKRLITKFNPEQKKNPTEDAWFQLGLTEQNQPQQKEETAVNVDQNSSTWSSFSANLCFTNIKHRFSLFVF